MKSAKVFNINTGEEKPIIESGRGLIPYQKVKDCRHEGCVADNDKREIRCQVCDAILDPFEFIWKSAMKENAAWQQKEYINEERKKLHSEVEKLKSQISYLKSQKRKIESLL